MAGTVYVPSKKVQTGAVGRWLCSRRVQCNGEAEARGLKSSRPGPSTMTFVCLLECQDPNGAVKNVGSKSLCTQRLLSKPLMPMLRTLFM